MELLDGAKFRNNQINDVAKSRNVVAKKEKKWYRTAPVPLEVGEIKEIELSFSFRKIQLSLKELGQGQ